MKRLVGVLILAGVPIACGVQTTSAPDSATLPTGAESGSVSALARGKGAACVAGDRSQIRSIELMVVRQGRGFVTVRAVIGGLPADTYPSVCLAPWWEVSPRTQTDTISDREQVTIFGPAGKYDVTGFSRVTKRRILSASTVVTIE